MSVFEHLPLGQRIPPSIHGVSCSIPTMRAVIGYEQKDPEITRHLTTGYPRFVQHPYLKQAAAHILKTLKLEGHSLWLTSSYVAAEKLRIHLEPARAKTIARGRLSGVVFPEDPDVFSKAKAFLQHTGMLLSSREAEDYLLDAGELKEPQPEKTFEGYPAGRVKGAVARAFQHVAAEDVILANNGMNAVYGAYRAINRIQIKRSRRVWVQLGWLYRDTIGILQNFTEEPARNLVLHHDVFDFDGLRRIFAERGSEIAGLITEVPTNPLIQTTDIGALRELCDRHGAISVIDPSIVSPLNVDILPYADVAVNSLTKYAANEGDVLMGAVVVNPQSHYAAELKTALIEELEPVYSRDVARLALEIGDYEKVIAQTNESAPRVVNFLQNHPKVREVFWTLNPRSRENYLKIARSDRAVGSMVSFTVSGRLEDFFDRLRLPKGPSFGMKTTLVCPFIYLAHYDLVTTPAGRELLKSCGISEDLIRLSIGCEPADDIIEALAEALA